MNETFVNLLRLLPPSGSAGFEGLIAHLLESLTGHRYHLAKSGVQEGRDITAHHRNANLVAIECKRYGSNTELDERELLGEIQQATVSIPDLDIWVLVTSRNVDSRLNEAILLMTREKGIEYHSISSGDGAPSSLEALCAQDPQITVDFLTPHCDHVQTEILSQQLALIASHPEYDLRVRQLLEQLSSPLIGYENWRQSENRQLLLHFSSIPESRSKFGQPINVQETGVGVVVRQQTWTELDRWLGRWNHGRTHFVLLGEEGDGKTWGVASWLSHCIHNTDGFPPILFFTSNTVSSTDPFELISNSISGTLLNSSQEQWDRRLRRWINGAPTDKPQVIIVVDGINERRQSIWWRELLEKLGGRPWSDHAAVIFTCRSSYWTRYFQPLTWIPTVVHTIPPYDDSELGEALSHHGLRRTDIQDNLLPLIRKPRYLALMVRHRQRMAESGDVTVGRLIYEDWRDRYERKQSIQLSHESFQDIIRELAAKFQNAQIQYLNQQEISELLPHMAEETSQAIFEELRTGGILQESRGRYQVNENMLKYGLGLLLVDQIEQSVLREQDLGEAISEWLEPHAEIDIKSAICGFAALRALSIPELPTNAKTTLLATWVERQNQEPQTAEDFIAYLPLDPLSYVNLAEIVWSNDTENAWAQDLLQRAFLHWSDKPKVEVLLQSAFARWLGFVHIYGFPSRRGDTQDRAEATRLQINERLGYELVPGPFVFEGYQLTAIDDDGLLRLGRAALAVISHLSRRTYIDAIVTGCVAEALMGHRDKYELFAWVIRTSREPLWGVIGDTARMQISSDHLLLKQVAYRLLAFEGDVKACQLQGTLPNDLFPRHPLQERLDRDHCFNRSPWARDQYLECLQRTDLEAQFVARQLRDLSIDPDLTIPDQYARQFNSLANSIQVDTIWSTVCTGSEDHTYEQYEPALCAFSPEATADFIRTVARTMTNRTGLALRQISYELREHSMVFGNDEKDSIHQAWLQLMKNNRSWGEADETAEKSLFAHVLRNLDGQRQLRYLIDRPEKALDLLSYEKHFVPVTNWQEIEWLWVKEPDAKTLSRALWFFSVNAYSMPAYILLDRVLPLIDHEDSMVRAMTLKVIYHSHNSTAIENVISGAWSWDTENSEENHWGSLLFGEFGSALPYAELRCRVHPVYLGYAVRCRQEDAKEVEEYANDIHVIWSVLGRDVSQVWTTLPPLQIQVHSNEDNSVMRDRVGLPISAFSHTMTFVNRNASWGGLRHVSSEEGWINNWNNWVNRKQDQARVAFKQAMKQQIEAGNHWFGRHFYSDSLDKVSRVRPDLVKCWIDAAFDDQLGSLSRIHLGSSFYQALCMSLLRTDPEDGVKLYWRLKEKRVLITVNAMTQIPFIDYALFKAVPNDTVVAAWNQRLEECKSDRDLLEIAMLASAGQGEEWLLAQIEAGIMSDVPYEKARAIALMGFCKTEHTVDRIEELLDMYPQSSWYSKQLGAAKFWQQRNLWCQHWFQQFWTKDSDDLAWASFRLFLRCVDSRFWHWRDRFLTEEDLDVTMRKRHIFLEDNTDTISNHIRKNEDKLKGNYLGHKALTGEIWPWMN